MKRIGLLTMAFLLAPVAGFAQDAPPAGPPPPMAAGAPNPQRFAEMRQDREQMEQLHKQARAQMLGAISPAHRALLANIIGQLAIAPNPDPRAAALQLDAALSGGEKQSILNVEAQMHAQMKTMMEAARARMESSMSADQRSAMDARMAKREDRAHSERTPDAGRALLGMAIHAGGPGGPEGMRPPR